MSRHDRYRLLLSSYASPNVEIGQRLWCVIRRKSIRVCGWSDGRIPWPRGRVGHGGKGSYIVTPELARAIRIESEAAICHWWGFGIATVVNLRRKLGVNRFNQGTARLYSLWKEVKLPTKTVAFSPGSMRRIRQAKGLTCKEVATRMGWRSINSYGQMEAGRRKSTLPQTLRKLARVLGCRYSELLA